MKTTKTRSIGASPTVKSTARRPSTQTPRSSVRVSLKRSKRSEPTEPSGRTLAPAHIQLPREGVRVESESVPHEVRSALTLYMQDAVEVPLLSIEEEIELAARIKKGDMAAREHMIRANLRLVVKIARDYDGLGLPLLDLINEGNIGLMKGVERFDPAKGGKLSTYAAWWIKQSIKRALANQSKTIRLPVHLVDKISKLRRATMELQELLGREPSDEELAEEMEVPVRKIKLWQRASMKTASLDQPLGDDESSRLGEVVPDEAMSDPYRKLEEETTHAMVRGFLDILDPRELTILKERFGLDGGPEKTLDDIGRQFGVTRERIRQLQNLALAKLRRQIEKLEAVRQPGENPLLDQFSRMATAAA
jgi:RNA polymerase primary sigma factor